MDCSTLGCGSDAEVWDWDDGKFDDSDLVEE